jgi:lipopolysaccharide/colanic/teichoic acid biosynthesis glycosyltransferase
MLAEEELHLQGIAHAEKTPRASSEVRFRPAVKRTFDIVVGTLLLVVTLPVMGLVALAIWFGDRGPILYRQRRVGFGNREFDMWKFRSMVPGADKMSAHLRDVNLGDGLLFKVADDPRVTPIGRVLRRLSLDELPQLLNVLAGDMSLVGPRPLPAHVEDFDAVARRRHAVRPGITGPWQVARDRSYSYDEMISLDLEYIERWSLPRDLMLLVLTIHAAVTRGRL